MSLYSIVMYAKIKDLHTKRQKDWIITVEFRIGCRQWSPYLTSVLCTLFYIRHQGTRRLYCLMVFNATFNNISVISWRSVLLVEETGGPRENYWQDTDKFYHIMLYTSPWSRFKLTTSVVIGTDYIGHSNKMPRFSRPIL
jgi:hypothetical protein